MQHFKNNIFKSGFVVVGLIFAGKIASFGRDIVISYIYGISAGMDAYFAANVIPSLLFASILTSALMLFIPIYNEKRVNNSIESAHKFASNVINIYIIASIFLALIGSIFAPLLVKLVAPGFTGERLVVAIKITRILCLSFPLSCIALFLSSILNAHQKHYAPQLIPFISSVTVILGIVIFSHQLGIYAIAFFSVFSVIINVFFQKVFVKGVYKHTWIINFKDPSLKKMILLIIPVFIGLSLDQINLFVDSIIGSTLSLGSLSALNYAQRLQNTINGVFTTAILTVTYPVLSIAAAKLDYAQIEEILVKCIRLITILLLPVTIIILCDSYDIVKIIFFRGAFGQTALTQTSSVFLYYAIGILFLAYKDIYTRIFYVFHDARTPLFIGIVAISIKLILNFVLVRYMDVSGLALATSISCIVSVVLQRTWLKKKFANSQKVIINIKFMKALFCASLVMVFCRWGIRLILANMPDFILLAAGSILSIGGYFFILYLFNIEEILFIIKKLQHTISRKFGLDTV